LARHSQRDHNTAAGPLTLESVSAAVFDVFRFPGQGRDDVVGVDTFKSSNSARPASAPAAP